MSAIKHPEIKFTKWRHISANKSVKIVQILHIYGNQECTLNYIYNIAYPARERKCNLTPSAIVAES